MDIIDGFLLKDGGPIYAVNVFVPGIPGTQGSKSYRGMFRSKKTGRMVPILTESAGEKLASWREDVRSALAPDGKPLVDLSDKPLCALIHFVLHRPKSTPKKWTPQAVKKPDLDKLLRAIFDAIKSAGIYRDDSQVVSIFASKRLADLEDDPTGCRIQLVALDASRA